MQKHVDETRSIWMRTPFAWEAHDCCTATCGHVLRVTGIDPAAPWRGTYNDEDGAQAIFDQYGGVLGLFSYAMTQAGFVEGENTLGAAVVAKIGGHEVVGVNMGHMIGFVAPGRGMAECRVPILASWPL